MRRRMWISPAASSPSPTPIHLSLFDNETSQLCAWHVPKAHYLESWSDARAWDGTASVCQPLIEPLYDGKTNAQMLAFLVWLR